MEQYREIGNFPARAPSANTGQTHNNINSFIMSDFSFIRLSLFESIPC